MNDRFLCADFRPALALRRAGDVDVWEHDGDFALRVTAAPTGRLIMVSQMYRPGWVATCDGAPCATTTVLGELVGIEVPAGATDVRRAYRPSGRVAARWAALGALIATAGLFIAGAMHRPRSVWPGSLGAGRA